MKNGILYSKRFEYLKTELLARRREILEYRNALRSNLLELGEPEKELEESASKEKLAQDLERLENRGVAEINAIDEALTRLEDGNYGLCVTCDEPISLKRLSALPWAKECVTCAASHETGTRGAPLKKNEDLEAEEEDDDEMLQAILDELERNESIHSEDLTLDMQEGLLSLSGTLRTEREHQELLEMIHEEFGIDDVLDRIEVDEPAYDKASANDPDADLETDEKETVLGNRSTEDDPLSSMENEENEPMMPPDRLRRDSKM